MKISARLIMNPLKDTLVDNTSNDMFKKCNCLKQLKYSTKYIPR
jgi:hypothetical protein